MNKIKRSVVAVAISVPLIFSATTASADTLTNLPGSYTYVKGYTKANCRGGHIIPIFPGKTIRTLRAFKILPNTTAVWLFFGNAVQISSADKCRKLHRGTKDKVLVRRG